MEHEYKEEIIICDDERKFLTLQVLSRGENINDISFGYREETLDKRAKLGNIIYIKYFTFEERDYLTEAIDLTVRFGVKELISLEEYRKFFPQPYIAYNEGVELLKTKKIKKQKKWD